MQFFLIEIEIKIRLLTKSGHIQITIMIDTQQQYIKLNIRGEISIIVMNKFPIYTRILLNCRTPLDPAVCINMHPFLM
jgi:hypothetical protein